MQKWQDFLNFLNLYGGLVGTISLILTIIISVTTGSIKRNVIQARQYKEYKADKRAAINRLTEIVASIELDQLYDNAIKSELLIEINKFSKYKGFIDIPCRYYVFQINHILASSPINQKNSSKIVSYVSKLCGRMSVDPVNKEMR